MYIPFHKKPKIHFLALSFLEVCTPSDIAVQGQSRPELRREAHSSAGKFPHLTPQLPLETGHHKLKHYWHLNCQIVVSDSDWASTSPVLSDIPQIQGFLSSRLLFHTSYFCLLKEMLLFSRSGKHCDCCYASTTIHHWLTAILEIHVRFVQPFLFFCPLNQTGIQGYSCSLIDFWSVLGNGMPPKFHGSVICSKVIYMICSFIKHI